MNRYIRAEAFKKRFPDRFFQFGVAELLAQQCPVPIEMVGMKDTFGVSGHPMELMKHFGLVSDDIKKAIKKVLSRKA